MPDTKLTMRVASHAVDVATILRDKDCVLVPASQTLNHDVERADLRGQMSDIVLESPIFLVS